MMIPEDDGFVDPFSLGDNANENQLWQERERRQRTVRLMMMFLMMLLLMDGEEPRRHDPYLRPNKRRKQRLPTLEKEVYEARLEQDVLVRQAAKSHKRWNRLIALNEGRNVEREVNLAVLQELEHDEDETVSVNVGNSDTGDKDDVSEESSLVFHYPWNATGYYRGDWQIIKHDEEKEPDDGSSPTLVKNPMDIEKELEHMLVKYDETVGVFLLPKQNVLSPPALGAASMLQGTSPWNKSAVSENPPVPSVTSKLRGKGMSAEGDKVPLTQSSGRVALQLYSHPVPGMKELTLLDGFLKMYDGSSVGYSSRRDILLRVRGVIVHAIGRVSLVANAGFGRSSFVVRSKPKEGVRRRLQENLENILLDTEDSQLEGRLEQIRDSTLQLHPFDHEEVSSKNGWRPYVATELINSRASSEQGHPSEEEIQIPKARAVPIVIRRTLHGDEESKEDGGDGTGKGVAGDHTAGTAIHSDEKKEELISTGGLMIDDGERGLINEASQIRDNKDRDRDVQPNTSPRLPPAEPARILEVKGLENIGEPVGLIMDDQIMSKLSVDDAFENENKNEVHKSKIVFPYPYVPDDTAHTIRNAQTPFSRQIPQREQILESYAEHCEFEISLDAKEVEWSFDSWKSMLARHVREIQDLDPVLADSDGDHDDGGESLAKRAERKKREHSVDKRSVRRRHGKPIRDEAVIMALNGTISSPNCHFSSVVNMTAVRTDWDRTQGKAINYSFYMMLTSLTQIVILLRQLLHTQSQSAAIRVSLICIGWQTVLDAMLCLGHIFLSLAMQPLFTAFASVAFFKLLIFCVIEMKYMAIIIQARNSSNGGQNTTEVLRRQVALLHVRFYVSLACAFAACLYFGRVHRKLFFLVAYSFWVPQIIQNVITEAKKPLHPYYIYGMSITRLVGPIYIFAVPNNFLKQVHPEFPEDLELCEMLCAWVAIQALILWAQSKYGTRFMIPSRFLPPKFDYSRPLPPALLARTTPPPGGDTPPPLSPSNHSTTVEVELGKPKTTGTRNRIKGNRKEGTQMVAVEDNGEGTIGAAPTLDCVICYNPIDVTNRRGYMLAPCDHIFHKDCLVQWMDVKMECPICRTELPTI